MLLVLNRSFPLHSFVLAVAAFGAVGVLACTQASPAPDETPPGPATAGPQVTQTGEGSVGATKTGSTCEELGTLTATSLTGQLDQASTPDTQFTSFTLPNRPVTSKLKVLAVGGASDLVGKTAVLGADVNKSWASCTHCVIIAIGCTTETDCSNAAFFFPRRGTGTFTALAGESGQPFVGSLDDVELEQVTIDPKTLASAPVLNGACMHVSKLSFSSTMTSTSAADPDSGTSTSTSGGGSSGTSGGSSGTSGTSGKTSTSSGEIEPIGGGGKSSTSSGGAL
jgi:hypothetical protein